MTRRGNAVFNWAYFRPLASDGSLTCRTGEHDEGRFADNDGGKNVEADRLHKAAQACTRRHKIRFFPAAAPRVQRSVRQGISRQGQKRQKPWRAWRPWRALFRFWIKADEGQTRRHKAIQAYARQNFFAGVPCMGQAEGLGRCDEGVALRA